MPNRFIRSAFWLLFFISGAIGLVYEVVELRLIHLAIGSSSISVYVVLSAFMAGLAIGSRFGGVYLDKVQRPLIAYALLELGVGLASVPFFYVGRWGSALGLLFTPGFLRDSNFLPMWRGFLAFLFLLPPSAFMGATLPALSRYFIHEERRGLEIGRLYALNTAGAVAGCFLTGFVFIDYFGVFGTLKLAIAASSTIAILAFLFGRNVSGIQSVEPEKPSRQPLLLFAFAVSGMAALAAETIWTRVLKFTVRTDVYAFSVMLSLFLIALAAGGAIASPIVDRLKRPRVAFGAIQAWIGITSLLCLRMFKSVAVVMGPGNSVASLSDVLSAMLKSSSLMLLPVLGLGAVFPVVARIASDAHHPASSTGRLLAANTIGAAAGPLIAGFLLIPFAGTAGSIAILSALHLLLAAIFVEKQNRWIASTAVIVPILFLPSFASKKQPYLLPVFNVDSTGLRSDRELLWFGEDYDVSAGIFQDAVGVADPDFKSLNVNGISYSGSSFRSRRYMKFLSYMPALLHPSPKRILVVCMGTGITAAAATNIPGVQQVDVVELSSTIVKALPVFGNETGHLERKRNVRFIVEDGRNFLQTVTENYDVVTAEPPPPREAGVVNLYTREYYEILKRRLSPNGIAVQWVPLSGQSVAESRSLIATFADAFREVSAWLPTSTQLILIGCNAPIQTHLSARASALFDDAHSRQDLLSVGFRDAADLLAVFVAANDDVRRLSLGATRVTDEAPVVEYFRRFGAPATGEDLLHWLKSYDGEKATTLFRTDGAELQEKAKLEAMVRRADWMISIPLLEYALSLDPDHLYLRRDLAITEEQRAAATRLRKKNEGEPNFWDIEARLAVRAGDAVYAEKLLNLARQRFPQDGRFPVRLSDLYRSQSRYSEAKQMLADFADTPPIRARLRLIELSANPEKSREEAQLLQEIGEWVAAARVYRALNDAEGIAQIENAFRYN